VPATFSMLEKSMVNVLLLTTRINALRKATFQQVFKENFPSRRWRSSLTVCARLTVRSSPHRHKRKFSDARVCRVTFKHLPQPLQSHILSCGTIGQLFKIPPFSAQKPHSAGGRGGPPIFFLVGILIFEEREKRKKYHL
jgi:hypothetical protein